ncbi:MAG TPA: group 1 truncated hemoglobin [Verrucomicrobiae bacterium]
MRGVLQKVRVISAARIFSFVSSVIILFFAACGTPQSSKDKDDDFFTSGSPEADRRAENITPSKDNGGSKRANTEDDKNLAKNPAKNGEQPKAQTLYQRLGEKPGIQKIVDDFVARALEDPRVNWTRKGVAKKSWFGREKVDEWQATPQNVTRLKQHFVDFIAVASGGPANYQGRPIKPLHATMQISKSEFDATIGDLKASLDKLQIAPDVQKDLLSIFESTRQQIVVDR